MAEIIYILTNRSLKGQVKIGITKNLEQLINSLDTADLPDPFQCYYAAEIDKASFLEKKLHEVFVDKRVNPSKGFFELAPSQVKGVINIASTQFIFKDVTHQVGNKKTIQKALQNQGSEQEEVGEMNSVLTAQEVRSKIIKSIQRELGITLVRKTQAVYIDAQTGTAVRLLVSQRHESTCDYWYILYEKEIEVLKAGRQGYMCFGFRDKKITCMLPIEYVELLFQHCGTPLREPYGAYHNFSIKERDDNNSVLYFSKPRQEDDLSKYIITLD